MKLPAIIAELKAALANDCITLVMDGRMIGVRVSEYELIGVMAWYERKMQGPYTYPRFDLCQRWGIENWTSMDYAVFGDGRDRRSKWVRKWLLREFGLREPVKTLNDTQESDHVWMEAANA
jgi:hypothetical protein